MRESTFFTELHERYSDDPEYIVETMLLALTESICEAMEEQGISRAQLAARLGVSRQRVTNFLNAPTNTSLLTVVKFAQALGLEVETIKLTRPGETDKERRVEGLSTPEAQWPPLPGDMREARVGGVLNHGRHLELAA